MAATIDIRHAHNLSSTEVRAKAEELANGMKEKLGIRWQWEGEHITFDAPDGMAKGSNGKVSVSDKDVRVEIDLPFLLKPMKGMVEGRVKEKLETLLK